ncbi:DUF3152 domain-containing protein [Streptomyces sp. YIM S03343]
MGRHSRRGLAARNDAQDTAARRDQQGAAGTEGPGVTGAPGVDGAAARGGRPGPGPAPEGRQQRMPDGTSAGGVPRFPDGTPAHGVPRLPDGTPARGVPRFPDGTPAQGVPRFPDGTPAQGVPRFPDGAPRARGGHPEQREPGGGWGRFGSAARAAGPAAQPGGATGPGGPSIPQQRHAPPAGTGIGPGTPRGPRPRTGSTGPTTAPGPGARPGYGPRQDYLDAFDTPGDVNANGTVFAPRPKSTRTQKNPRTAKIPKAAGPLDATTSHPSDPHPTDPFASVTDWPPGIGIPNDPQDDEDIAPTGEPAPGKSVKGRTYTGIAAAAVTTVLAIVVAGQVADGRDGVDTQAQSATDQARDARDTASGGVDPRASSSAPAASMTYAQKMDTKYALGATLKGSGKFDTVPGADKAPGKGRKYTYRVDVEQGLGLDGALFAEAVQKTLNDDRSWSHDGARTFERISTGKPDFVITLASPGTTAVWCAKSGLDTTEDNVSCDSASTERVMINAYRWAQGSKTYGDAIHAYRQMLINHEVGHRLGYHHVTCEKDGELAPVMQQQTKFLDHEGIHCLPNPWPYPKS